MALLLRITNVEVCEDPEDFLNESLATIFPDDVMTQHGDASHALRYTSPHLPKPLYIRLADPDEEEDRVLFGHYLWNASLMLAEFIEAGTSGLQLCPPLRRGEALELGEGRLIEAAFDVRGLSTIELGSGTALPSILSALSGAKSVVATDYPSPPLMELLHANLSHNTHPTFSPLGKPAESISVEGHAWGDLDSGPFTQKHKGGFDRVLACDCLWMPWQHDNLRRSISWFMKDSAESRAWIVAGFHTGRHNMVGFFDDRKLAEAGLELEKIWERDVEGQEREWAIERKDDSDRRRWLVVASVKKKL
ncbi:hypothetical protein BKA67DRAFT_534195 [Truncatella angustata]|uniref:Nicotinamide N-methyltransferase n=1 Tax=Truncatella angustata TaxID=152316 RepID=A0A9P8UN48_9PEZI|nr:uncharacterized protein BKA67DRAFT_534195 [Truncatella angustata]KAH6655263.1 hypothetical protein BKA67DRAFT_534195 [Truncatella angustata]KAH8200291.1 hypothetical protein TruAng_005564 [Truncatella angustata]